MSRTYRLTALLLCLILCLSLCGCSRSANVTFKIIGELDQEEFCVAFRKDDPLCEIVTAAMEELSMGMSGDYRIAARCGATMVRIGSAIFGPRHYA